MPSSPNYQRNYRQEAATESPERKHQRALRNQARRVLLGEGLVHKGDGKAVDHKRPLSKNGTNGRGNLRVRDSHANDSYHRNSDGSMKYLDQH